MDLVYVSAAMSLDGHIDDTGPRRLLLSGPEDFAEVDRARAECDAILVGAETIRRDNPSLVLRDRTLVDERTRRGQAPEPTKVTLTASGLLEPSANFFTTGGAPKFVLCSTLLEDHLRERLGDVAVIVGLGSLTPFTIIGALASRGIRSLFVEGGTSVLTAFLAAGTFHRLRLAVAPFFVGDDRAPRLVHGGSFVNDPQRRLRVTRARLVGDVTVVDFVNEHVAALA